MPLAILQGYIFFKLGSFFPVTGFFWVPFFPDFFVDDFRYYRPLKNKSKPNYSLISVHNWILNFTSMHKVSYRDYILMQHMYKKCIYVYIVAALWIVTAPKTSKPIIIAVSTNRVDMVCIKNKSLANSHLESNWLSK